MTSNEEFRLVDSLFGLYEISESGVLRRVSDGKVMRAGTYGKRGYLGTLLRDRGLVGHPNAFYCKNDVRPHVHVKFHVLVAEAFIGKRPDGLVVDHIDHDITNNHYSNLRYVTLSENRNNISDDVREKMRAVGRAWCKSMSSKVKGKETTIVKPSGETVVYSSRGEAFAGAYADSGCPYSFSYFARNLQNKEGFYGYKIQ